MSILAKQSGKSEPRKTKRWPYILLALILVGAGVFYYFEHDQLNLPAIPGLGSHSGSSDTADPEKASLQPAQPINWRSVNRQADGFQVEMPAGFTNVQTPAYNENGGMEPVEMLYVKLDNDVSYAVTWLDNPPVARVNGHSPDRTLEQARDGMLARTETTLASESNITVSGSLGREILAHNATGGILNAQLIFVSNGDTSRLYTLMALFPSASARRQQDVSHFFNSFVPQTLQAAASQN